MCLSLPTISEAISPPGVECKHGVGQNDAHPDRTVGHAQVLRVEQTKGPMELLREHCQRKVDQENDSKLHDRQRQQKGCAAVVWRWQQRDHDHRIHRTANGQHHGEGGADGVVDVLHVLECPVIETSISQQPERELTPGTIVSDVERLLSDSDGEEDQKGQQQTDWMAADEEDQDDGGALDEYTDVIQQQTQHQPVASVRGQVRVNMYHDSSSRN